MRILLLGKSGQVGQHLAQSLSPLGRLTSLGRNDGADLTKVDALVETIRSTRPDIIVNAAAYTAVDKAEDEPELAHLINAVAPRILAQEAARLGSWLVHYSTDYVFDGSGTKPWTETDLPAPLNAYGASKLAGERAIQNSGCLHLILRASWIHAAQGKNFITTILDLAKRRETLSVVNDQVGSPTGAQLLANVTAHALAKITNGTALSGLYHVAAAGETSWYNFARCVVELARDQNMDLAVKSILPVRSLDFATQATRPLNSRLDTRKFRDAFDVALPDWRKGVAQTINEICAKSEA